MGFGEAVGTCLRKYAVFEGRARRSEYWWFTLAYVLLSLIASVLDGVLLSMMSHGAFSALVTFGLLLPALGVGIRRMHDTDRSGWWILIGLVPLIGTIIFLILAAMDGTKGPNRFGPDPKEPSAVEILS